MKLLLQFSTLFYLLLIPVLGESQSFFSQFGNGIKTNFHFVSGEEALEVIDQGIYSQIAFVDTYDGGGSQQKIYLELMTKGEIKHKQPNFYGKFNKYYEIIFKDKDGVMIQRIQRRSIEKVTPVYGGKYYVYTISLEEVPLILIDHIKTIHFTYYNTRLKKE